MSKYFIFTATLVKNKAGGRGKLGSEGQIRVLRAHSKYSKAQARRRSGCREELRALNEPLLPPPARGARTLPGLPGAGLGLLVLCSTERWTGKAGHTEAALPRGLQRAPCPHRHLPLPVEGPGRAARRDARCRGGSSPQAGCRGGRAGSLLSSKH